MPNCQPLSTFAATARPQGARWRRALVAAWLVAGIANGPVAYAADGEGGTVPPSPPSNTCSQDRAAQSALSRIAEQLHAQGMELQAQCHAASGAWMVQVKVVDGMKASKVVRGPLADGHEVDMGTPAGVPVAGAPANAGGFSPDVQFNRQWLRTVMAQQRFSNLPDAWWHFAQQGSSTVKVAAR